MSAPLPSITQNDTRPAVSVVVAGRNRPDRLRCLLESLRAQTFQPLEVIIVDDASEPALPLFEGTLQLRNETPQGACHARNRGFQKATGKYVFVFDDDAELADSSLVERAVQLAEQSGDIGAVALRQLDSQGVVHWMQPGSGEQIRLVPWFGGYGALISRKYFEEVGGFLELLGYYYEEVELCLRLMDRGCLIVYDPSLKVLHHEEQKGRDFRKIHRLCWRNIMYTIVARHPLAIVPGALLVSIVRWVRLAASWKHFRFADLAWGIGSLMKAWPKLISLRRPVRFQTLRKSHHWRAEVIAPWPPAESAGQELLGVGQTAHDEG